MEESIVEAHRTLDVLFEGLRTVLRAGPADDASRQFVALRDALDAHFEQEDALYYPTIGALRPDTRPTIHAITEAHGRFREHLETIGTLLERGADGEAVQSFESFVQEFSQHERQEEALVRSVEASATSR